MEDGKLKTLTAQEIGRKGDVLAIFIHLCFFMIRQEEINEYIIQVAVFQHIKLAANYESDAINITGILAI